MIRDYRDIELTVERPTPIDKESRLEQITSSD